VFQDCNKKDMRNYGKRSCPSAAEDREAKNPLGPLRSSEGQPIEVME
jgi:hypothetical protein